MTEKIKIFDQKKVRTHWDEIIEEWYFSITDVVAVLTESLDPNAYWRKLKQRLISRRKSNRDGLSRFENDSCRWENEND